MISTTPPPTKNNNSNSNLNWRNDNNSRNNNRLNCDRSNELLSLMIMSLDELAGRRS